MRIRYYIDKIKRISIQKLPQKICRKIKSEINYKFLEFKDTFLDTHISLDISCIQNSYIDIGNLNLDNIDLKTAQYLSKMYTEHKFDLLGSGWVENSYSSSAIGVEDYKYSMNIPAPQSVHQNYKPIDWQKDFKSGFRWNEKKWYKKQYILYKIGCDLKVPWELSRMQHLPQLALFTLKDARLRTQNIFEFKYQVLDFIENNPPRMGITWTCTMDVGIRAANMLLAYDLFTQIDKEKYIRQEV